MLDGRFFLTPAEQSEQKERIKKHTEEIDGLAAKYELTLTERWGYYRYDPRYLTPSEVEEIVTTGHWEESKLLSSRMRKQLLVLHACRVRKNAPNWQHEQTQWTNLSVGMRSTRKRARTQG